MKKVIRWYLPWIIIGLLLTLFGCAEEGAVGGVDAQIVTPRHGPGEMDAGVADARPGVEVQAVPDAGGVPDTVPVVPDVVPVVPADAGTAVEAARSVDTVPVNPSDTLPACPTVTVQPPPAGSPADLRWAATVQATSTDGFCFKTCDTPIFGLTWKAFSGRTLTVNGAPVYLVGANGQINSDTGSTESVPTAIAGTELRTFQVSAGASASAAFTWYGGSVRCS